MSPDLAATLLDLYARAAEAAGRDDIAGAGDLVAAAGEALSGPLPAPPADPGERAAVASLVAVCEEARVACLAAIEGARERLVQRAIAEQRSGSSAGRYAEQRTPDARFIDRRG